MAHAASKVAHRLVVLAGALLLVMASPSPGEQARHYAANNNFDASGHFAPMASGFDLADVSRPSELDLLPNGVLALVWIGRCTGADNAFTQLVSSFRGDARIFGYYLMDDPDPTGRHGARCDAGQLREEVDWIHSVSPRAKTFIVLMNQGRAQHPRFDSAYRPENSHVDLFGISPYPCRSELAGCDFSIIARYVAAAEAAGIPRRQIVPTYQTFGGGSWRDDGGGTYQLPSASAMKELLAEWHRWVDSPAFDYAYSWGAQRGDRALENAPELRSLMSIHNARRWSASD